MGDYDALYPGLGTKLTHSQRPTEDKLSQQPKTAAHPPTDEKTDRAIERLVAVLREKEKEEERKRKEENERRKNRSSYARHFEQMEQEVRIRNLKFMANQMYGYGHKLGHASRVNHVHPKKK